MTSAADATEAVIATRAAAAVTAGHAGRSAHTAAAWIDALTARALMRAERRLRRA